MAGDIAHQLVAPVPGPIMPPMSVRVTSTTAPGSAGGLHAGAGAAGAGPPLMARAMAEVEATPKTTEAAPISSGGRKPRRVHGVHRCSRRRVTHRRYSSVVDSPRADRSRLHIHPLPLHIECPLLAASPTSPGCAPNGLATRGGRHLRRYHRRMAIPVVPDLTRVYRNYGADCPPPERG